MSRIKPKGIHNFIGEPTCVNNGARCYVGHLFCEKVKGKECNDFKTEEDVRNASR